MSTPNTSTAPFIRPTEAFCPAAQQAPPRDYRILKAMEFTCKEGYDLFIVVEPLQTTPSLATNENLAHHWHDEVFPIVVLAPGNMDNGTALRNAAMLADRCSSGNCSSRDEPGKSIFLIGPAGPKHGAEAGTQAVAQVMKGAENALSVETAELITRMLAEPIIIHRAQ